MIPIPGREACQESGVNLISPRKRRILLIGGGHCAHEAHWPAIRRDDGAALAGIVDLESQRVRIGQLWPGVPFYPVDDSCNGRESAGETYTRKTAIPSLEQWTELAPDKIDAAVVSTYGCHYEYVKWSLNRGWHVLVDKPLTVLHGMVTDATKARALIQHFDELTDLAHRQKRLFTLATQRRYSEVYGEIARELEKAARCSSDPSTNFVRSVQAFTSDGYFMPLENYAFGTLGGKIKNTGYHVVDIVTWLLRRVVQGIDSAVIQVSPLCIDGLARLAGRETSDLSPSELYASIQVTFRKGNVSFCVFQFHAQHENFAARSRRLRRTFYVGAMAGGDVQRAFQNRTKEEELRIALGPFFRVYFRRVARVLDGPGCQPGERSNAYVEFSRSYPGTTPGRLFEARTFAYEDPDSAPAEEFLKALRGNDPASAAVRSRVKDHAAAVSVFSGIYEGIAKARDGDFGPVHVDLRGRWFAPPSRGTVMNRSSQGRPTKRP